MGGLGMMNKNRCLVLSLSSLKMAFQMQRSDSCIAFDGFFHPDNSNPAQLFDGNYNLVCMASRIGEILMGPWEFKCDDML